MGVGGVGTGALSLRARLRDRRGAPTRRGARGPSAAWALLPRARAPTGAGAAQEGAGGVGAAALELLAGIGAGGEVHGAAAGLARALIMVRACVPARPRPRVRTRGGASRARGDRWHGARGLLGRCGARARRARFGGSPGRWRRWSPRAWAW